MLSFLFNAIAETRAPSTVAIGATVLCAAWIGLGLGHIQLLRGMHTEPRLLAFTVLLTVWAADTFAYVGGRLIGRHKMAPTLSPGKTWEGFALGSAAGIFVSFVALYSDRDHYLEIWQAILLGVVVVCAAAAGDQGHGGAAGRPRRRARPHRLAALRGAGRVLPRPRLSLRLSPHR